MFQNAYSNFESKIQASSFQQLYIPEGTVCAELSQHYAEAATTKIREFISNPEIRVITFGYSSGGAREHILYRAEDGTIYIVYREVCREDRLIYLTTWILRNIFENFGYDDIPDFENPVAVTNYLSPPVQVETMEQEQPEEVDTICAEYESKIHSLTFEQKWIPSDCICANVSRNYAEIATTKIREFLSNTENRFVIFGYSSGGARTHILYRAEDGTLYIVYRTTDRGNRIYYLTDWILGDIFREFEHDVPEFKNPDVVANHVSLLQAEACC
jgi:hypothetical protein